MKSFNCIVILLFLISCQAKTTPKRYKLMQNSSYAWGDLFDGGKITITDLSYTGLKFRLQIYNRDYPDFFSLPILEARFSGPNVAVTGVPADLNEPQFAIHVISDSTISIEQLQGAYVLPWLKNEHAFIKDHALTDNSPSLPFLNARLNYKVKRKTNGEIQYLAQCLQHYKKKKIVIDGIDFTCYSGAAPVGKDTLAAMILTRDSFFTGAIVAEQNAKGFSNDPYLGRQGQLEQIFSSWFHEKTNLNISYYYYNAYADSL